ncbi:hypothetical protein LXL04_028072 [Taraxacum kok-saghyz]
MELQLALSLSSSSSSSSSQFDLNIYNHDTVHEKSMFGFMKTKDIMKRKVCVNGEEDDEDEEEEELHAPKTLPLLFSNNSNQDYADDVNEVVSSALMFIDHKHGGDDENEVIGWPPVKSCRKKLCHRKNDGGDGGGSKSKSMFVKVQMEGDGIARKIDLNLHNSYHTLIRTLAHMFGKCEICMIMIFKSVTGKEDVKLTYQDQEGDWLLATDLPWGYFSQLI